MTENQKQYADLIQRTLGDDKTIVLVEEMKMAIVEALKVHVQPQGKKNKVFQAIVPSANGNWSIAVKNLRTRINHVYGETVV
ncbi:MAG: hypothetical protein RR614_12145 [Eubacterium sp.]